MSRTDRNAALVYGIACYAFFFVTFLYLIGWLTNLLVPVSIDSGVAGSALVAIGVDLALIALFGLQHSVMARPGFKRAWTRVVPPAIERPTYVLASTVVLVVLFALWQPIPAALWRTEGALAAVLQAGGLLGFGIVLYSTFLIDHFDLFGLRQVFLAWRGRPYTEKRFMTPQVYRFIRHPLYVGWMTAFWCAPVMSVGRLLFALAMTAYILVAIRYEERDLAAALGEPYRRWRSNTPMFVPRIRGRSRGERESASPAPSAS
jgi:protein-S-isoprenylcysteine O-methyltransferase Ste14